MKEYIQEINKKTIKSPIFYITQNIERALGLEELLSNFHIVYGNNGYISDLLDERGVKTFYAKNNKLTSLGLIQNESVKEYINKNSREKANLQYFKISKSIEIASAGFNILNAKADVSHKIENKITQYVILKDGNFPMPKIIIKRIGEISFKEVEKELGESIVIQFDLGHSGNSTFFINSEQEFNEFVEKYSNTNMILKIAQKMNDNYVTINCLCTKNRTYVSGLCNQITGLTEIGAKQSETCGNNWCQVDIDDDLRDEIINISVKLGDYLYSKLGYRGMFGIDFSITENIPYILEVNARQTASVQNYTKLQIENDQIPMSLISLMEFLDINFDIDNEEYNRDNNMPIDASVVIFRNHFGKEITIDKSYNGIYDIEKMKKEEDAYSITELYSKSKALILESIEGSIIKEDEEFLKILAKGNQIRENNLLDQNILSIYNQISKDIRK